MLLYLVDEQSITSQVPYHQNNAKGAEFFKFVFAIHSLTNTWHFYLDSALLIKILLIILPPIANKFLYYMENRLKVLYNFH